MSAFLLIIYYGIMAQILHWLGFVEISFVCAVLVFFELHLFCADDFKPTQTPEREK